MIDFMGIITVVANMAVIAAIVLPIIAVASYGMTRLDRVITKRNQHRDTLAEIRRLKADQAYACLHDMAEYLRAELKHGGHDAAEYTAYEHCQKNFWGILENNGIHLDEEYR